MSKKKDRIGYVQLTDVEMLTLAVMNLQASLQNLMMTGSPKTAVPTLEESFRNIDPLAMPLLEKMANQEPPPSLDSLVENVMQNSGENIIDFKKNLSLVETEGD